MRILNLTQHTLTLEQEINGAYTDHNHEGIKKALTFTEMPDKDMVQEKVIELLDYVHEAFLNLTQMRFQNAFEGMQEIGYSDEEAETAGLAAINNAASFEFAIMIGGAPYLMAPLESALKQCGFRVVYAYSERIGKELVQPNGKVLKSFEFKHLGFYEA